MLGRRVLLGALVILNLYLLLTLVWGGRGMFEYLEQKGRRQELGEQLETLEGRSLELSREIRELTSNPDYQRQMVRERMNYVGEKEILYVFPQDDVAGSAGAAPANEAADEQ